jgi:ATP-dependent DNA helicase RecQ
MTEILRNTALAYLRTALSNDKAEFREHQLEAISALLENGRRVLLVQRTGWVEFP